MPLLAAAKRRVGLRLASAATVSESAQNLVCAYLSVALMIVSLIARELRHAGIQLGPTLALRLLSEIHETTLVYPAAGGRQGRPRTRTQLADMDDSQRQLFDALALAGLAPGV
jgi:hypothetical protein